MNMDRTIVWQFARAKSFVGRRSGSKADVLLREQISHSDFLCPHEETKGDIVRVMSLGIPDMPPPVDDIAVLLETVIFRYKLKSRAEAWSSIGINPSRGRDLLARSHSAFDWPLWFTLREKALGSKS